jgi:uncharacterized protein (TIGR03437 family)
MAADGQGNIYVADRGSHQVRLVRADGFVTPVAGIGVAGFSGDGGEATLAGLHAPSGVAIDEAGNVWIADTGNHRIRRITPAGVIETAAGDGRAGFGGDGADARFGRLHSPSDVVVRGGEVFIADLDNRRVRRLSVAASAPSVEPVKDCSVVHAATFAAGVVAPGQIATIFGSGIGPDQAAFGRIGASGAMASNLDGAEVRVGGIPAPLFYAGSGQINIQVPSGAPVGEAAIVDVLYGGRLVCRTRTTIQDAAPGFFALADGSGHLVALNQDGALNAPERPAGRGAVVTLYATGEGRTDPPVGDGVPAEAPLPRPLLPVHVRIAGLPVEVLYAGAAPGFAGLMQVNVRIPGGLFPSGSLPVSMYVGTRCSPEGTYLSVR